jgi:hypothetical protein
MRMGLLTGLLTFPLAPVRGTMWVAEQVLAAAEEQYYDPARIRARLEEIEHLRRQRAIDEVQARTEEEELVQRLLEGRRRREAGGG